MELLTVHQKALGCGSLSKSFPEYIALGLISSSPCISRSTQMSIPLHFAFIQHSNSKHSHSYCLENSQGQISKSHPKRHLGFCLMVVSCLCESHRASAQRPSQTEVGIENTFACPEATQRI